MNEKAMWNGVRPALREFDPHRIENGLAAGTPDVNYTGGWIELKYLAGWPKREATPVHLPAYTGFQAAWLWKRWKAGGATWLLVRVDKDHLLFSGWNAYDILQGINREGFERLAVWRGRSMAVMSIEQKGELSAWLRRDPEALPPHSRAKLMRLLCCQHPYQVARDMKRDELWVNAGESVDSEASSDLIDHWAC